MQTDVQFEWAWQKPELSRHLRDNDLPLFKKDAQRNWVERKLLVAKTLLTRPPFSRLPLNMRFFDDRALRVFEGIPITLPTSIKIIQDLGGVSGSTGLRDATVPGVTAINGPIDVKDTAFREDAMHALAEVDGADICNLCKKSMDITVRPTSFFQS